VSEPIRCFKSYDVRGRIPDELNEDIARRIGRGYAEVINPGTVVVGHDIRLTSESIKAALVDGLREQGVDVFDIGQCGTEEIYFATAHLKVGGGICVTASHNPKDYNGMKFVRAESKPISGDSGLKEIQAKAEADDFVSAAKRGGYESVDTSVAYVDHLLSYVDLTALKPLKIVCTAGNGGAGRVVDLLEPHLPFEFVKLHHEADGHFPNGVPNPMLEENRIASAALVRESGADLGIAWDGDFDRCFFYDDTGQFIEGYYVVGLLASAFLAKGHDQIVVHDPRLTWNTIDVAQSVGGSAQQSKTGHAFIKETMRRVDAVYGGEMSAHHYFRDFAYCDSGMIPWLLVAEIMSTTGKTLASLVEERTKAFPCSGEINRTVSDAQALIAQVESLYAKEAKTIEHMDGLSLSYDDWRFNLRMSNTEPVVRLNVESRGDEALMRSKTQELLAIIDAA
jgi:phosphomannomutase